MALPITNNQKLFSIIIATHNCGLKIKSTLESIFSQNRELFEVIIFDNVSTDDTLEHINKYEKDLTLVSEVDDGIYFALNKGIDLAAGQYLYFIGAGDCLKPGVLERVKESLSVVETPAFVYGKCYFAKQKTENGKEFDSKLFIRDNLCQQGIFYSREVFNKVGKFDLQYKILSDWMFNLKCFLDERVAKHYLDLVIADYEEGGLSSELCRDPVFLTEFPQFVKKHFGLFNFLICKAFLKNPTVFNLVYYGRLDRLPRHFASQNKSCRNLVKLIVPYASSFQNLWKRSSS